jgi:hypothetical protein
MKHEYWSWFLSIIGVIGLYITGQKKWQGFAVGVATEVAWIWYSIITKQWGFIFGATIYIAVYLFNIKQWWQDLKNKSISNKFVINLFNYRKVK